MDTRRDHNFIFAIRKSQVSNLFIRVRRFCSKTASRFHDLVSNDPILDPKVVPDELGPLAEPGWPGLASQAARSCRRGPGWPPPGGPGHHSTDPRTAENALTAPASRRGCARSGRGALLLEWGGGARTRAENFLREQRGALGRIVLCHAPRSQSSQVRAAGRVVQDHAAML